MRIIRFAKDNSYRIGIQLDEGVLDLTAALEVAGAPVTDILTLLRQGRFRQDFFENTVTFVQERGLMEQLMIREPVSPLLPYRPPKIVALGLNYMGHAAESGFEPPEEPIIFTKASTCVIGPEEPIQIKRKWGRIDPEVEFAVIIGKRAKNVAEKQAGQYIAGYSIMNDVTARAMQSADFEQTAPWYRSKSIDTFGPFGPCIVTATAIPAPVEVDIELAVNGEVRQKDNTRNLIFGIPKLIAFISDMITLEPGDVISTGTPEGISEIVDGDVVECRIDGIGVLRNSVMTIRD